MRTALYGISGAVLGAAIVGAIPLGFVLWMYSQGVFFGGYMWVSLMIGGPLWLIGGIVGLIFGLDHATAMYDFKHKTKLLEETAADQDSATQ